MSKNLPIDVIKGRRPALPETCPVCGDNYSLTPDTENEDGTVAREFNCGAFYDRCPVKSDQAYDVYVLYGIPENESDHDLYGVVV